MARLRLPLVASTALLLCAALSACSDDDGTDVVTATSIGSPSTSQAATTITAAGGFDGGSTTPVSTPALAPRALLRAIRSDHHPGFDRVVFEFENVVPGYQVMYVPRPVVEDGSGDEITLKGAAVLQVRMENAGGAEIIGETVRQTYTGPTRITPGTTGAVRELARAGDFEGVLSWVIGVDPSPDTPFKVSTLTSPARLVVDVRAP